MEVDATTSKLASIRKQVEFYFGDSNLDKDRFLRQKIEEDSLGCMYAGLTVSMTIVEKLIH